MQGNSRSALYRRVISLLSLLCLLVMPATAVARRDPPVIHDAAVVEGKLTVSVTTDGLEARARAERAGQRQFTPRPR